MPITEFIGENKQFRKIEKDLSGSLASSGRLFVSDDGVNWRPVSEVKNVEIQP